ncbi:MAG TPA: UDP-N-acetylmuramoyl-tripeptide--D-alanyl-D-alanine ligase [Burkholderiaceae bacterium]|nr:UDP-N-acetylmuramoyl-tripeptide--D-alanyl-D-alanine ligase [Burkholderiaceae bacterium]
MSALMTVSELGRAVGAREVRGDGRVGFSSVSTDTRTLAAGALFVALRGERFDGHAFAEAAVDAGAVALLVEQPVGAAVPQIIAVDSRRALGTGAAQWRARFSIPVIAITGSNGKTTVTQMVGAILAQAFGEKHRLATQGNLNNEIGVPLMLWKLGRQHKAAVFELGMNHPGEIATLAEYVRPTVALVNNAQREHQEFMRSVEATAHENGEVIASLPLADAGAAVFPADDACSGIWRALAGTRRVVDFALEGDAVVTATCELDSDGASMSIVTPVGVLDVRLSVPGLHNVRNALAAAACAIATDVEPAAITAGLAAFRPVGGRGVRLRTAGGAQLIDDSYNANPDSVRAAIELLARCPAPRILVLGDMGEVGDRGPEFHREVGAHARECGLETLLGAGTLARQAVDAFGQGARHYGDVDALIADLRERLDAQTTVLVKGSRFMRMERVVRALTAAKQAGAEDVH